MHAHTNAKKKKKKNVTVFDNGAFSRPIERLLSMSLSFAALDSLSNVPINIQPVRFLLYLGTLSRLGFFFFFTVEKGNCPCRYGKE